MTALEKYPSHKSEIRTCWLEKKCLTLALATILSGMTPLNANSQKQKPEKVSPETEMLDKNHQEDEGKGRGYFILPSLNLLVSYNDWSDYGIEYPFDPQGAPILPPGAEIDLPEVFSFFPETAINANFFIRKGDAPHIVRIWDIPIRSISGNYEEIAPGIIKASSDTYITINNLNWWSYHTITFNGIGVPQEEINGSLNDLTPTDTLYLNKSGIDLTNFPWTNTAFGNTRKIWIIQGEGDENNRGHGVAFDWKDQGRLFWNEVTRISSGFTTVEEFYENYIASNPRVFNNPSRQETKTIGNQTYTISYYRVTRCTDYWWSSWSNYILSDVITFAVVQRVETANTLTTTPSIEWENWSWTIEFSDTDNTYPAWTPVPTWVPLSITITPDEGTIVKKVIVDGENYGGDLFIENIILSAENQNHSIKIICENQTPTHSIDLINWEHGTTEIHDAQGNLIEDLNQVPNGTEIQVKATSDEGYYVSKIEINGVEHLNNHHINPFVVKTIVQSDMTVESFYKPVETSSAEIAQSKVKIWTSKGEIIIMPQGEAISNLIIYNSQGEAISYTEAISEELRVRLRKGVYFVSFDENRKRITKKVLVE